MAALYAWPSELRTSDVGLALTFVVPAQTCNLSCGFCAIKQRGEAAESTLSIADYVYFLTDIASREPLAIASIQGYEPLLSDAWPFTSAIISAAHQHNVPISLVTNGILLEKLSSELVDLSPTGITVSLDSFVPRQHDKIRGKQGAFEKTLEGLRCLTAHSHFRNRVTVSSVLLPHRRQFLDGMPELLSKLGVLHWVVSPLLSVGGEQMGGPVGDSHAIIDDLLLLQLRANKYGVSVVLDDELGSLPSSSYPEVVIRQFERPDGLIRLTPNGACSAGKDILKAISRDTPRWIPAKMEPHEFVRLLLSPATRKQVFREAA